MLLSLSAAALLALPTAVLAQGDAGAPPKTAAERTAEDTRKAELNAQAKALRHEAEATFVATEAGCYQKFLVNRCIDQSKQLRLETIQRARALEAEARKIDLAQRQRAAAEVHAAQRANAPASSTQAAPGVPAADVATPAATAMPVPAPDAGIAPSPEAERIRAERARDAGQAAAGAEAGRAARDAEKAAKRAETEAEAAARAAAAERDRARYEERIRKYEEDQAARKK